MQPVQYFVSRTGWLDTKEVSRKMWNRLKEVEWKFAGNVDF